MTFEDVKRITLKVHTYHFFSNVFFFVILFCFFQHVDMKIKYWSTKYITVRYQVLLYKRKTILLLKYSFNGFYLIHKYMFKEHRRNPLFVRYIWMTWTTGYLHRRGSFGGAALTSLQIRESTSFVPHPLSVPSPQDCCEVFLHSHLFSMAAVAVGEYPVRMPFR